MQRVFIHLPPFERRWKECHLADNDLRLLQLSLMLHPTSGDVVPGTHGIRKVRWATEGMGKRGGLRIFYVDFPEYKRTHLITMLRKSDASDLTREQRQMLATMVLELTRVLRSKETKPGGLKQ